VFCFVLGQGLGSFSSGGYPQHLRLPGSLVLLSVFLGQKVTNASAGQEP